MKYCKFCGKQISDYADICMHCGRYQNKKEIPDDAPSTGIAILSFIFPVLGFILWLVWKPTLPQSKERGKGGFNRDNIGVSIMAADKLHYFWIVCCFRLLTNFAQSRV